MTIFHICEWSDFCKCNQLLSFFAKWCCSLQSTRIPDFIVIVKISEFQKENNCFYSKSIDCNILSFVMFETMDSFFNFRCEERKKVCIKHVNKCGQFVAKMSIMCAVANILSRWLVSPMPSIDVITSRIWVAARSKAIISWTRR